MAYLGNIGSLMASDFALYQREDHSKRIQKLLSGVGKTGKLPSIDDVRKRFSLSEVEAKRLLASAKRQQAKSRREAEARASRKAAHIARVQPSPPATASSPERAAEVIPVVEPDQPAEPDAPLPKLLHAIKAQYSEEIRLHGEQTLIREGFIYLVTHCCFAGWVKAGMTIDYEVRLGTYNVSDPLSRFKYAALEWTLDRRKGEAALLGRLARVADQQNGEWFQVSLGDALKAMAER